MVAIQSPPLRTSSTPNELNMDGQGYLTPIQTSVVGEDLNNTDIFYREMLEAIGIAYSYIKMIIDFTNKVGGGCYEVGHFFTESINVEHLYKCNSPYVDSNEHKKIKRFTVVLSYKYKNANDEYSDLEDKKVVIEDGIVVGMDFYHRPSSK